MDHGWIGHRGVVRNRCFPTLKLSYAPDWSMVNTERN